MCPEAFQATTPALPPNPNNNKPWAHPNRVFCAGLGMQEDESALQEIRPRAQPSQVSILLRALFLVRHSYTTANIRLEIGRIPSGARAVTYNLGSFSKED